MNPYEIREYQWVQPSMTAMVSGRWIELESRGHGVTLQVDVVLWTGNETYGPSIVQTKEALEQQTIGKQWFELRGLVLVYCTKLLNRVEGTKSVLEPLFRDPLKVANRNVMRDEDSLYEFIHGLSKLELGALALMAKNAGANVYSSHAIDDWRKTLPKKSPTRK